MGYRNGKTQVTDGLGQKAGIFEPAQQSKPQDRRKPHTEFGQGRMVSPPGHQTAQVVDQNGCHHQQNQLMGAPLVEKQAEGQQHQIAQLPHPGRNNKIDHQQARQKAQQKFQTAENHGISPSSLCTQLFKTKRTGNQLLVYPILPISSNPSLPFFLFFQDFLSKIS